MKYNLATTLRQAVTSLLVLAILFFVIEPAVGLSATATSQFTISQAVTSEISFLTTASNVVMSPSLGGLTGGTATGSTYVRVNTSNLTGYTMTLQASSSLGMIGNASSTNYIPAYVMALASGTPDYNFTVPANAARFGYTVIASTTTDVTPLFHNNGSACYQAVSATNDGIHCWTAATSTALTIINRTTPTPASGATTTLNFQVTINPNPAPVIPNDTYVATTTLTATAS
jgi:hypothetical protein